LPLIHYCSVPACPNESTDNRGRCSQHATQINRQYRDPERQKIFNSKAWKGFRKRRLVLNPICERCKAASSVEVHHIIPLAQGGDVFTIPGTMALCKPCHAHYTWIEIHGTNQERADAYNNDTRQPIRERAEA
jgi:5-methylcytosine-specific restriction endonuclease McrA